jgi:uncharacterized protein (DUF2236 family)
MYLKGTAEEGEREKLNEDYKRKFEFHEKKKRILDLQYEKSSNSLQTIKKYLEDIFEEIAIDPDTTEKLRTSLSIQAPATSTKKISPSSWENWRRRD